MRRFPELKLFLLVVLLLCCGVSQAREIKATNSPGSEDPYSLINKVTLLQSEKKNVTIKVFETGGGDPAMNGNNLVIHINRWDPEGTRYTWPSGIDIYEVKGVKLEDNKIIITCTEHIMSDNSGRIGTSETRYSVSYFFDKMGYIKDIITVEKVD